jgi:hypothetical protein
MPTIMLVDGYRFFFFSKEGSEPAHIHVEKAGSEAKFWLDHIRLARNNGFASHELKTIHRLIEQNRLELQEAWDAYHTS